MMMITGILRGFTSSLFLVIFVTAQSSDSNATVDVPPKEAQAIYLPTIAGTFRRGPTIQNDKSGQFFTVTGQCGKMFLKTTDIGHDASQISQSVDLSLECYPHPQRVVIQDDASKTVVSPGPNKVEANKCQGLQNCGDKPNIELVPFVIGTANMPTSIEKSLNDEFNVCPASATSNFLFTNEMGCQNPSGGIPDHLNPSSTGTYRTFPRWKTNEDGFFDLLRPFMYQGKGQKKEQLFERTNSFLTFKNGDDLKASHKWHSCKGLCDRGNIIKYHMKQASWKTTIYLTGGSKGFKMCIKPEDHNNDDVAPKCREKFELFVLPQNGVVIWPKTGRASMLEMKGPSITGDKEHFAIEVGFGYGKGANGQLAGEFYVANQYREMVVSDSDGWDVQEASEVAFFFEDPESLMKNGGIFSPHMTSGRTYYKADAQIKEIATPSGEPGKAVESGKEDLKTPKDDVPLPNIVTTTPASKRISSNAQAGVLLQTSDNNSEAIYLPGKWWAWGIYIGFIAGSLGGVGLISLVFYFLRRSAYGFWYRGMYKRYGCDASGTTGGITGAITVGGTTGGGGTTAGTTGTTGTTSGMTTKGSTSGGTTGSMTSTGGASTIAM
ncbi:hypothetical protein L5515_003493 [Caenorhabditis briggsae]|uniref:Uncharacterized protein n=1 Tax=Caenorhabditis briggsae TaxID=6238 RepID=A0AAE9EJF6_CAEBR|nr:hypothetical protein L5515_003493 [Caenorhabditis briggsae]